MLPRLSESACHVMDQLITWKVTRGEKKKNARLKQQVEGCFMKTYICVNLGVKYSTILLRKDVQFSSGKSQNHYCLFDVVCVDIKKKF